MSYAPIYEPTDPRNAVPRWMVLSGEPPVQDLAEYKGGSFYRKRNHDYPEYRASKRTMYRVVIDGVEHHVKGQTTVATLAGCSVDAISYHLKRRNSGLDPLTRNKKGSKIKVYKETTFK